jgi:hypothetical protein
LGPQKRNKEKPRNDRAGNAPQRIDGIGFRNGITGSAADILFSLNQERKTNAHAKGGYEKKEHTHVQMRQIPENAEQKFEQRVVPQESRVKNVGEYQQVYYAA